jgi:hypothetical protein
VAHRANRVSGRPGLATVRARLRELPPPVLDELIEVLEIEQIRLQVVARGLSLVREALRGHRYVPRL